MPATSLPTKDTKRNAGAKPVSAGNRLQVFLHCVAKDGPHADQKFDKRSRLGITHKR